MCALPGNNVHESRAQFERVTVLHGGWYDVYRKSIIKRTRARHSFARFRVVCRGLRSMMLSRSFSRVIGDAALRNELVLSEKKDRAARVEF